MAKSLNDWAASIHVWAKGKGWWDKETDNVAAKLLMMHTEISEAVEELRIAHEIEGGLRAVYFNGTKPEGFGVELADLIIRTLDLAAHLELDVDALVETKMKFNVTRQQRHGDKAL